MISAPSKAGVIETTSAELGSCAPDHLNYSTSKSPTN
jgi:hypothetical protein